MLTKPELFDTRKGFLGTMLVLLLLLCLRLGFEYREYREFISKPFYFTYATVLYAHDKTKNGKSYTVLKLRSDEGFTFYTTSYKKEDLSHTRLRLQIFPSAMIPFYKYMGTFYVKSRIKKVEVCASGVKENLLQYVAAQHDTVALSQFYNAIFFATPIDKKLREKISLLGVSHLVALSGFHLGILWGMVYFLLMLAYKPLQQKYFPYRFSLIDMGLVTIVLLGVYLWFVDFPPSLLRSYAMLLVGWFVLIMGVELLSFTFLTAVVFALMVLFPALLFSLSFWLSVSGVFYIFLLLYYSKTYNKWMITLFFIPLGIFLFMLPIVHHIFGMTSPYQLYSPFLSLLFIPFYPLVMVLHLLGIGGILDSLLLGLFALPKESVEHLLPWWITGLYVGLSVYSIFEKKAFYVLLTVAVMYGMYIFIV